MEQAQQSHRYCMVCGEPNGNPDSLQLKFRETATGAVEAQFQVSSAHQGYNGLLHGGMTSTLLDAAMTHCLLTQGLKAVTAELTVRFISPIVIDQVITITAQQQSCKRGIYRLEAFIHQGEQMLARAVGKFIEPNENLFVTA